MSSFIKAQVFQKPFKVFFFDENTRIFIDRLAGFNSLYRTFGISYDNLVKTLYLNFTEKKANAALFELKKTDYAACLSKPRHRSLGEKIR